MNYVKSGNLGAARHRRRLVTAIKEAGGTQRKGLSGRAVRHALARGCGDAWVTPGRHCDSLRVDPSASFLLARR